MHKVQKTPFRRCYISSFSFLGPYTKGTVGLVDVVVGGWVLIALIVTNRQPFLLQTLTDNSALNYRARPTTATTTPVGASLPFRSVLTILAHPRILSSYQSHLSLVFEFATNFRPAGLPTYRRRAETTGGLVICCCCFSFLFVALVVG